MIVTDPGKLVQVLKSLHKLWEDENPFDWVSQTSVENFHNFITKKGKYVGITNDIGDLGFWYNAMADNEDLLSEKTLTKDNVVVPKEREIEVEFMVIEWEKVANHYKDDFSSYFTPNQIDDEFWFFRNEDYLDPGNFTLVNKDYIDGEIEDERVTSVREITPQQKEGVDNYMTNLSEGELNYIVKKLLNTHLHRKSK